MRLGRCSRSPRGRPQPALGAGSTHILLNNGELAKISEEQRSAEYAVWQTSLLNPNFSALARDCGAYGKRVSDRANVKTIIGEALDYAGPA